MRFDRLDKRLATGLGPAAATALNEWATLTDRSYRSSDWFVNGMSTATVAAVYERGRRGARKLILKHDRVDGTPLDQAEFARHDRAVADCADFAGRHLTTTVDSPVRVGDGSWITFQTVAGGALDEYRVLSALLAGVPGARVTGVEPDGRVRCDRATFAGVCAAVTRGLLADWAGAPDVIHLPVVEVLRRHLLHRLRPGQPLHRVAQDWPGQWVTLPGEAGKLPNPFALAGQPALTGHGEVPTVVGRAHGDLHPENILVRVEPLDGDDFHLIDLSRYGDQAPLTRDPVQLLLTIVDRARAEISDQHREVLLDLLLDVPGDGIGLLPAWLPELVGRVRDAGLAWVRPFGLVDEWRRQTALSMVACALMFLGRPATDPGHGMWFLRLAARAADVVLTGTGGVGANGAGTGGVGAGTAMTHPTRDRAAAPHADVRAVGHRTDADDTVARLCVSLPALRRVAGRHGRLDEVDALVARARLGDDVVTAYADLARRLSGPDEEVRQGLSGFGGGRPVTGEVYSCPLSRRPCGRAARRPPSGAAPSCHLTGATMTRQFR